MEFGRGREGESHRPAVRGEGLNWLAMWDESWFAGGKRGFSRGSDVEEAGDSRIGVRGGGWARRHPGRNLFRRMIDGGKVKKKEEGKGEGEVGRNRRVRKVLGLTTSTIRRDNGCSSTDLACSVLPSSVVEVHQCSSSSTRIASSNLRTTSNL